MNNTQTVKTPSKLDELGFAWTQAKAEEEEAKTKRLFIEQDILSIMPSKDEGTCSQDADYYKVSASYGFTRSVDQERLTELRSGHPDIKDYVDSVFVAKTTIDLKSLRYVESKVPDVAQIISQAITVKPKKASITIKEIKQQTN